MEIILAILIIQILLLTFCVQLSTQKMSGFFESKWQFLINLFQGGYVVDELEIQSGFEVQTNCHQKQMHQHGAPDQKLKSQQENWFDLTNSHEDNNDSFGLFKNMAVNQRKELQPQLSFFRRLSRIDLNKFLRAVRKSLFDVNKISKARCFLVEDRQGEKYQDSSNLKFLQFQKHKLEKILHQKTLMKQKRIILNKVLKLNQKIFKHRSVFPMKTISEKNELNYFK